jgi:hypothetical protein
LRVAPSLTAYRILPAIFSLLPASCFLFFPFQLQLPIAIHLSLPPAYFLLPDTFLVPVPLPLVSQAPFSLTSPSANGILIFQFSTLLNRVKECYLGLSDFPSTREGDSN